MKVLFSLQALKAWLALGIAATGSLTAGAIDGHLSLLDYLVAAGAGLTALGAVFGISNSAK